jgi:hypothetical protein
MNKHLKYTANLGGLTVTKTDTEQNNNFFYSGHPEFLIPDFNAEPCDIWLSFLDYLEAQLGEEVYDQNGGEVESHKVTNPETGLTICRYVASEIQANEDSEFTDYTLMIVGYVVTNTEGRTYFLATEVNINESKSF